MLCDQCRIELDRQFSTCTFRVYVCSICKKDNTTREGYKHCDDCAEERNLCARCGEDYGKK